jgi:hypothetical protein
MVYTWISSSGGTAFTAVFVLPTQAPRSLCVPQHPSISGRLDPVSARRASGLGFVAQPSNMMVLWWTAANPACRLRSWAATLHQLMSLTSSCFSCHHAVRTWSCSATVSIELCHPLKFIILLTRLHASFDVYCYSVLLWVSDLPGLTQQTTTMYLYVIA